MIRSTIIVVLMLFSAGAAFGQKYPERRDIRSGNKLYEKGDYTEAEVAYRRALEESLEALGRRLEGSPAVRLLLFDSETENEERKLFQCFHPECLALAKQAKGFVEEAKVALRNIRRDGNEVAKKAQKDGVMTEDELKKMLDDIQKLTDRYIASLEKELANKEKELMTV